MKSSLEDNPNEIIVNQKKIDLFQSLDQMWLHNWDEMNKPPYDLKWIIKNEEDRELFVPFETLDGQFLVLMDEWFKLTDATSSRRELNVLLKKVITARQEVIKGNKFEQNWVNRYESMITDLVGDNSGYDPNKQRMQLSVAIKMFIDKKKITVADYYSLIEVVMENNSTNPESDGK